MQFLDSLAPALRERVRILTTQPLRPGGEFVLYWMRNAMRADENPALDVSVAAGNAMGLPVLVFQELPSQTTYASDRHHTFVLEGARDVARDLRRRGVTYVLHVERPAHPGRQLITLADRAALVVTEEMPVEPLIGWTQQLVEEASVAVIGVDTACVVPMQHTGKAFERAYAYRDATRHAYEARVGAVYEPVPVEQPAWVPHQLPFVAVDLDREPIPELVRQCDIDHSIGPVPHTVGGSTAGYARWDAFRAKGLEQYDRRRNDALIDGVSRMSAYLHYGMVAPTRLAREAAAFDHPGAEKYLDELLIWRELAYVFCFHRPDHDQLSAVPDWAVRTLRDHAGDARPALLSWETLARGQTGDALWDAAQQSLLMQGELHNNVRMTWGKALLAWTAGPEEALAMMVDLNHRYALDGRDPASYGGLLWCLGQFDRPFSPPRAVLGTVRHRSTAQHAQRLDTQAFRRKTSRPLNDPMPRTAVIGAGLSGLLCARVLADHGFPVTVFEKSRGAGGRMATRRTADQLRIDHGAQFFTVRDERFRRYVNAWIQDGCVAEWPGNIVAIEDGMRNVSPASQRRFVGTPSMNAIAKHLARDLDVQFGAEVAPLQREKGVWHITQVDGGILGEFDVVVCSSPPMQTAHLLNTVPAIAKRAADVTMDPCWSVMLALPVESGIPFDAAFVNNWHGAPTALSWIARNSSKPNRATATETWVLHAGPEWSREHLEADPPFVTESLLAEFWKVVEGTPLAATFVSAHRWRYALCADPLDGGCLFDREARAVACGDWCCGPRVEGAFLSGLAAAGSVMGLLESSLVPKVSQPVQQSLF